MGGEVCRNDRKQSHLFGNTGIKVLEKHKKAVVVGQVGREIRIR